jgi:hypothetical protein
MNLIGTMKSDEFKFHVNRSKPNGEGVVEQLRLPVEATVSGSDQEKTRVCFAVPGGPKED